MMKTGSHDENIDFC